MIYFLSGGWEQVWKANCHLKEKRWPRFNLAERLENNGNVKPKANSLFVDTVLANKTDPDVGQSTKRNEVSFSVPEGVLSPLSPLPNKTEGNPFNSGAG